MANRNFPSQRVFSFHLLPVMLDAAIVIGATGAVSSVSGQGILSATRNAQGDYTLTFKDSFSAFLFANFASKAVNATTPSDIAAIELISSAANSVRFMTLDKTGALADPASGSQLLVQVFMNNSGVQ